MKKPTKPTRANKFEKNRKIARIITLIISVTLILMLVIFGAWLLGGNNSASNESMKELSSSMNMTTSSTEKPEMESESSLASESSASEEETKEESEAVETEETTPSDDNVLSAVTGDWKPIGTQQEGEHATNYDTGSQDRNEIKQAAAYATGLDASDMIEWRIENDGDQKVLATVSDSNQTETYRIYLSWVDNQGWQPTKVEQLKVNDKN
ncbi:MAG: YrrS family protein [Carnobacterium sp.]|uniref:YrrS family protein n=1 Tax=Carnobacterium antarcticum TaxID=2126436 RepID=A0ABW4NQK0_9LACT|nr:MULTISPECIES: YrrS family protein [unclassified Carnobacterium]ALV21248.1 hypothetical protein NY10_630 [Carnobacterium sp. CP1]QQP69274.1 YrrS family protein [Carnobacterium sp. CS13]